jgi:hypothetical protein
MEGGATRAWYETLRVAQELADDGSPARADSLLVQFSLAYPGSSRSPEASYWRAYFRLDPRFGSAGARDALSLLDAYLGSPEKQRHRDEALALKRVAEQVVRLNTLVDIATARPTSIPGAAPDTANRSPADARGDVRAAVAEIRAQDAEIRRLKDALAKANAELERIKTRLAEVQKRGGGGD